MRYLLSYTEPELAVGSRLRLPTGFFDWLHQKGFVLRGLPYKKLTPELSRHEIKMNLEALQKGKVVIAARSVRDPGPST